MTPPRRLSSARREPDLARAQRLPRGSTLVGMTPGGTSALISVALLVSGCYSKEIGRRSMLAAVPGAEGKPVAQAEASQEQRQQAIVRELGQIRVVDDDGVVTLLAGSGRDALIHTIETLAAGERELFVDQVLSTETKARYAERGLDPAAAFDDLADRLDDLRTLNQMMPFGERTPGVRVIKVEPEKFLIYAPDAKAARLRITGYFVVVERGQWKFHWTYRG